jgi:hypothetical protein
MTSPFSRFFDQVCEFEPFTDHAELADVLYCVEHNDDDIALMLYSDVLWVISQWHEPVMVRLLVFERLISKFAAPSRLH